MTNRKTTKKALLGSLLALVLCFSMLVGTTFAWFTDSEFMNDNVIKAGTLDIELGEETTLFEIYENWEPGYTTQASNVLKNIGTLALKYKFSIINVVETDGAYDNKIHDNTPDGSRLADVLEVYVGKTEADMVPANFLGTLADLIDYDDFDIDAASNGEIKALLPGEEAAIDLIIHMTEEAGNEYMNDSVKFDIAIVATQFTYEENVWDDPTYDAEALYPAVAVINAVDGQVIDDVKIDLDDYYGADNLAAKAAVQVNTKDVVIDGGQFYGGTTPFGGAGNAAVWAYGNATLTINDGYFYNKGLAKDADGNLDVGHIDLIYASQNAKIEINGGFFEGADETVWLLNCQDGKGARITVNGGTFVNWNPAEKASEVAAAGKQEIKMGKGTTVTAQEQDNGDIWYVVSK